MLSDLRSEYLAKCQEYLSKAEEKDKQYDKEYHKKAKDDMFKV